MTDRQRVIFLDIDGVLLRPVDWMQPHNATALGILKSQEPDSRCQALGMVKFDPVAVDLVNRLARQAAAKIVVSSLWRRAIGTEASVKKVVEQGIDPALLHDDAYCSYISRDGDKKHDIEHWLADHRATPLPERPVDQVEMTDEEEAEHNARLDEWQILWQEYGIDWVVLDDQLGPDRLVQTHPDDGFTVSAYRVALRALGATDPEFSIYPLPDGIWDEVVAVHAGDRIAAARWLESVAKPEVWRPARMLHWQLKRGVDYMLAWGALPDGRIEEGRLLAFRERLMADRPEGVGQIAAIELHSKGSESEERPSLEPRPIMPFKAAYEYEVHRLLLAAAAEGKDADKARQEVRHHQEWQSRSLLTAEKVRAGGDLMTEPDPSLWPLTRWVFGAGRPRPTIVDKVRTETEDEATKVLPAFLRPEALERTDQDFGSEVRQVLKAAARASDDLEAQVAAGAEVVRKGPLHSLSPNGCDERMVALALMRAACRVVDRHRWDIEEARPGTDP